jgi:hypothetical protein
MVYVFLLLFTGCSRSEKIIVMNAPPVFMIEEMKEFCAKVSSDIDELNILAIRHNRFKCQFSKEYECEGYKLKLKAVCKNGATLVSDSYSFGNDKSIIIESEDKTLIDSVYESK